MITLDFECVCSGGQESSLSELIVFLGFSHCGEFFNDLGNGVLLTHVVDVHSSERETAVQLTDKVHVLELGHDWVLEAFLQEIIISLLHA